jgi:hypothetical protein
MKNRESNCTGEQAKCFHVIKVQCSQKTAGALGPGAALKKNFSHLETVDLGGLAIIYELLIFLPAGLLIGMAARKWDQWNPIGKLFVVCGLLLQPVLFDLLPVAVSWRSILPGNTVLSLLLGVVGAVLINADRPNACE